MNQFSLKSRQQGMTLIEIMVALVLGVFLLAGVINIYIGSNQSYRMLENLSRMQENGRFAMDFISRDIRMAGLRVTCFDQPVPVAITGTNDAGLDGSDTITTQVSTAACPVFPSVLTVDSTTYSIANGVSNTPALFILRSSDGVSRVLVEGVEDMQILYGEDIDGNKAPDYYVSANEVVDMDQVVSVRVNLLVASAENNLAPAPVDYHFNGNTMTPSVGDKRIRWEFSSTIAVRNRLP